MPVRPRREPAPRAARPPRTESTRTTSPGATTPATTTSTRTTTADARATTDVLGGLSRRSTAHATRGQGTSIAAGVFLRGGRLIVDEQHVVTRAALARSGGSALLVAATRMLSEGRPGNGPIAKLSPAQRKDLIADVLPLVEANAKGTARASLQDVRARAGAFAILEETVLAMRAPSEQRAALALAQTLLAAAGRERDAGLRVHMERRLGQLPARVTGLDKTGVLETTVERMRARRANEKPLRQEWLKGTPPTLKVLASVQDEFWKSELSEYKKQGYDVTMKGKHEAVATKTFENGVVAEVHMQERDTDVLDGFAVRDADIVLYTGHANLGGITKIAVDHAPSHAGGNGKADKLVALFACRSKQNVDAVDRKFPGQHLLVSAEGTYGHDDRIVLHALIEGIANDKSYAQIEMAAKRKGLWESKNYFMPNETNALTGQERVFIPHSKTAQGKSISMRPRETTVDARAIGKGPVDDAVEWVNTIHGYWAETFGRRADNALHDQLISGGFFDGTAKDPVVKFENVKDRDGEDRIKISVNKAYASQDPDALAMMVTFATAKELAARGDPSRSEHDKRMLALGMVSSYVYFMVEYSDVADTLLKQFAKTHGFPPGLSWPVVEKAINADPKNDCSPKTLAALERGMEHVFLEVNPDRTSTEFRRRIGAALDVLKNSGSKLGLATHEAIVTGKVKVDEMDDLEKRDYLRIRRDYLKEGVNLPIEGHKRLHDHSSKAWRAITTDMDGYMWDDRIYISHGLSAEQLAKTLVHEVNHVLNESEEHYRGQKAIFAEEYRAFYAEALYAAQAKGRRKLSAEECREIKEGVIHDYGLKNVSASDIPDVPKGFV